MPTLTDQTTTENGPLGATEFSGLNGFMAAATLLQTPRLARHYVYICYYGPTTVQTLIEELNIPRATTYDDIERLESLGIVERDETTRPHKLTATPFAFVDENDVVVTPTLFHTVALSESDDDVEYFLNRYGVSRLAAAVRLAGQHYAGKLTQRMAAKDLNVTPVEGMAIIYALKPALATGKKHDPYFSRLFEQETSTEMEFNGSLASTELTETSEGE